MDRTFLVGAVFTLALISLARPTSAMVFVTVDGILLGSPQSIPSRNTRLLVPDPNSIFTHSDSILHDDYFPTTEAPEPLLFSNDVSHPPFGRESTLTSLWSSNPWLSVSQGDADSFAGDFNGATLALREIQSANLRFKLKRTESFFVNTSGAFFGVVNINGLFSNGLFSRQIRVNVPGSVAILMLIGGLIGGALVSRR